MAPSSQAAHHLEYTPLSQSASDALEREGNVTSPLRELVGQFASLTAREPDQEGTVEHLDGVAYTHHFVQAPGDSEELTWHYAECGEGEPIVFLHGVPGSWFSWHHQASALSESYRCLCVDLKGYGQSDKRTGDYRQEGVAEQLLAALDQIGVGRFHAVGYDRGAVVMDYLAANHAARIHSYVRAGQHLYHFNPVLAPQEQMFVNPETAAILRDPVNMVIGAYSTAGRSIAKHDLDLEREIQEFAWPQVGWAVPRYFNSSSFRKEWIDRRTRLMQAWTFPLLLIQGRHDTRQPPEFYEHAEQWLPQARVEFVEAGHFFVLENPDAVTQAIQPFLASVA